MSGEEEYEDLEITRITITRTLTADGQDQVDVEAADSNNEMPSLIEMLGLLDLARDTAYQMVREAGDLEEEELEDEDDDV